MKKKEEKNKVGRPKLADDNLKKKTYIMLGVALLLTICLTFGGLFSLTNINPFKLKGEAQETIEIVEVEEKDYINDTDFIDFVGGEAQEEEQTKGSATYSVKSVSPSGKRIKAKIAVKKVSSNAAIVAWASDNAGISSFTIYKGSTKIVTKYPKTNRSDGTWKITGLSPNTKYKYSAKFTKIGYDSRILNQDFKTKQGAAANTVPNCSLKVTEIGEKSVKFAFDAGTYYKNSEKTNNEEVDYTIYEGNGNGKKAYHEGTKLGKAKTILVKGKLNGGTKYLLSVKFDKECKIGNNTSKVHNVSFVTKKSQTTTTKKTTAKTTVPACAIKIDAIAARNIKFTFNAGTYYKSGKQKNNIETSYTIYDANNKKIITDSKNYGIKKTIVTDKKLDELSNYMLSVKFDEACKLGGKGTASQVHNVKFKTKQSNSLKIEKVTDRSVEFSYDDKDYGVFKSYELSPSGGKAANTNKKNYKVVNNLKYNTKYVLKATFERGTLLRTFTTKKIIMPKSIGNFAKKEYSSIKISIPYKKIYDKSLSDLLEKPICKYYSATIKNNKFVKNKLIKQSDCSNESLNKSYVVSSTVLVDVILKSKSSITVEKEYTNTLIFNGAYYKLYDSIYLNETDDHNPTPGLFQVRIKNNYDKYYSYESTIAKFYVNIDGSKVGDYLGNVVYNSETINYYNDLLKIKNKYLNNHTLPSNAFFCANFTIKFKGYDGHKSELYLTSTSSCIEAKN